MLAAAVANGPACKPDQPLTPCEAQIFTDAVVWKKRALKTRARFEGCAEKLEVITSSAAASLAPCPQPPPPRVDWSLVIGTTGGGVLLGVVLGVLLAK
ncbi:MAG: hypothetical protein CMJ20_02490 [Phycisphaeraceae bacterium]|nr:hypothetical protein [Phycisphaeraceae bacterium]